MSIKPGPKRTNDRTDELVEYWSSHENGALSEGAK
jgi:hypothetical protein